VAYIVILFRYCWKNLDYGRSHYFQLMHN